MDMPNTKNTFRPTRLIAITVVCGCILLAATGLAATTSTQAAPTSGQGPSSLTGNHLIEDAANPFWTGEPANDTGANSRDTQSGDATITDGDEGLR